jgi:chitosanase
LGVKIQEVKALLNRMYRFALMAILVLFMLCGSPVQALRPIGSETILTSLPVVDLSDARKKEIAMQIVSSAENSTTDWKAQYAYIEDINDGRGYTGGIIGFCSGTGDMLEVVRYYTRLAPDNISCQIYSCIAKG